MLINGENLPKTVVKILEREEKLIDEINKINDRFQTAFNLKNNQELRAIEEDGMKLQKRVHIHTVEKITVMTMFLSKNRNYIRN